MILQTIKFKLTGMYAFAVLVDGKWKYLCNPVGDTKDGVINLVDNKPGCICQGAFVVNNLVHALAVWTAIYLMCNHYGFYEFGQVKIVKCKPTPNAASLFEQYVVEM